MNNSKKMLWQSFVWLMLVMPMCAIANVNKVNNVRVLKTSVATRLFINYAKATNPHVFTLQNPNRLVIDVPNSLLQADVRQLSLINTSILSVMTGQPERHMVRLVFYTKSPIQFKILSRVQDSRLVVDLYPASKMKLPIKNIKYVSKTNSSKPATITPIAKVVTSAKKTFIVVIDPGHGGKDPGATGERGTHEKDVVLAIAKKLAVLINNQPNMHAVLTRNGDYFVYLRGRLKLAHKGNADLFVSIHADSFFKDNSRGASVYALSQRGATSEAARWLAKRENTSELGDVDLNDLGDQSHILRSVLIDLAQTATNRDSLRLGNSLLDNLEQVTTLHYSRVEQAPFVVLKSPDIPSVLVETGFISNPREEARLRDKVYQTQLANAIFAGINLYIKKYT